MDSDVDRLRLGFVLVLKAPKAESFLEESGWRNFALDLLSELEAIWQKPAKQAPCRPLLMLADSRELAIDADLASKVLGPGSWLSLWVPQPLGGRLPRRLRLKWKERVGVWATVEAIEKKPDRPGIGRLFIPSDEAGAEIPTNDIWTLRESTPPLESPLEAWTEPLVLDIERWRSEDGLNGEPKRTGDLQNRFWQAVVDQAPEVVVDVHPRFLTRNPLDPDDRIRVEFYTRAGERLASRAPSDRSLIQQLVFGGETHPQPLWFLILDALGGEFRLPALEGAPNWEWLPPDRLSYWDTFLAKVAVSKAGLRFGDPTTASETSLPPSPFSAIRWAETGAPPRLSENWHRLLAAAFGNLDGRWQAELVKAAIHVLGSSEQEVAAVDYELLARQASAAFLLPRSPIRVELPACPAPLEQAGHAEVWVERVTGRGWLDLKASALWPEKRWPAALLGEDPPLAASPWPLFGSEWHHRFYASLHESPASSFGPVHWVWNKASLLGEAKLGTGFILGSSAPREIEKFQVG